jgi:hypothetical protein
MVRTPVSILVALIGLVLMVYKIYADSEPGLIPLLLVVVGSAWYIIARARTRWRHEPLR